MGAIRVLIVDDSDDDALLLATHLRRSGFDLTYERAQTAGEVAVALAVRPPDIVISDYSLPGFSAQEALGLLQDSGLDASFILVSGALGEETAAAIMKAGAHDFVLKDRLSRLAPAVQRELRDAQVRRQQRHAEAALRASEERFRLLAEHVQDIIFRYRLLPEAVLEYISPAVAGLTGYQPEELYANPDLAFALMDPEDRHAVEASWSSPKPPPLTLRWRRPDGSIAWTELRAVGVQDDSGQIIATEGILRDVTSQVLADQEHARLDRELRQADRLDSLGRLAGGIAHDFNNLLAVILAYASMVTEQLDADHPCQPDLDGITKAAERAAALTRQLLIFSTLEPSQPETLDLNSVVTDIKELLERTIGEDIEFRASTQAGLHPVTIDRSKIEQVIMNLVINSRDAMPDGGRLNIETANLDHDDGTPPEAGGKRRLVSLTVTDSGTGMPPEVLQRAFERFYTTKGPAKGTGLGLSTVYGVVKEAGGEVRLHSEPGQGTAVTVLLPGTAPAVPGPRAACPGPPPGQASQTILVVEDNDAVRQVVTRMLTRAGYQVIAAPGPRDALEIITNPRTHIDALLTDLVMPDMSGAQLAKRVRDLRHQLPVLLMSGYTAGAVDGTDLPLIRKPFNADALLEHLQGVLARS